MFFLPKNLKFQKILGYKDQRRAWLQQMALKRKVFFLLKPKVLKIRIDSKTPVVGFVRTTFKTFFSLPKLLLSVQTK
jgi:hypothetical protein